MIDWLKRDPLEEPSVQLEDRVLPIVIRRLANARRMTLRLAPDGSEARISIPPWGRTAEALAFARSRKDWLARQIAAIKPTEPVQAGGRIAYRGDWLVIDHRPDAPRKPRIEEGAIRLGGTTESLGRRLRRWLESEARDIVASDLAHYCARAGKEVPHLSLTNARRRWGSCSASGSIRINWRLIMAPDSVRRSVVAHEVAHLVHLDHSPRFHALLGELYEGHIAQANAWLKREGASLYYPFG